MENGSYIDTSMATKHIREDTCAFFKGIMPYLGIVIFTMVLMYIFPGIALWFPDYLFGVYVP